MDEFIALALSVLSRVIVSLVTLGLAGWQRARQQSLAETARREAILAGIGRELQWNRTATRESLDAGNAHYMIGRLSTVVFERHGSELATIAPDSVELVFRHYATVGIVREGIRNAPSSITMAYCGKQRAGRRQAPTDQIPPARAGRQPLATSCHQRLPRASFLSHDRPRCLILKTKCLNDNE